MDECCNRKTYLRFCFDSVPELNDFIYQFARNDPKRGIKLTQSHFLRYLHDDMQLCKIGEYFLF